MSMYLNAFPVSISTSDKLKVCFFPYDLKTYKDLKLKHGDTHFFYKMGNQVACISTSDNYPISGELRELGIFENIPLTIALVKDSIVRCLKKVEKVEVRAFDPIKIVSRKTNVLDDIFDSNFPFAIFGKYEINVKKINSQLHVIIDCSTKKIIKESCSFFLEQDFILAKRIIFKKHQNGDRKILGKVLHVSENLIQYQGSGGKIDTIRVGEAFLEANIKNFHDYTNHCYGINGANILEKIRVKIGEFNGGVNKKNRIDLIKKYLSNNLKTLNGIVINIEDARDISKEIYQIEKTSFLFDNNYETSKKDGEQGGLKKYGPYGKPYFDRNKPSICVICSEKHKGEIEQFIRKFLKGIHSHKYYADGFETKFSVGISKISIFTFNEDNVDNYRNCIEEAMQKIRDDNKKWDLALVQIKQSFKNLPVEQNPYYAARALFLLHQVPIQDFTIELLKQNDISLGYSLNNMALACYVKMGGVPWLLKSSPPLSHEIIIGIGCADLCEDRFSDKQRFMGITTVFSGDGNYIVSNISNATSVEYYEKMLIDVLKKTIEKVSQKLNWQPGDCIRIIFHASIKRFNQDEIKAIKKLISLYPEYQIEYTFLKISEKNGFNIFNSDTATQIKGKYAPLRGQVFNLSEYENLVYLIGQRELKQVHDGHPRGLVLSIHEDSTFKDIKYLTAQLFNFSAHSCRSYFPNPMPVTIAYSDLIAQNLGWLDKTPGWNETILNSKIGLTQWFL